MKNTVRYTAFMLILTVTTAISGFWGFRSAMSGEPLTTLVTFAFAGACSTMIYQGHCVRHGRVSIDCTCGPDGTVITPSKTWQTISIGGLTSGFLCFVLFAVFEPQDKLDIPTPQYQREYFPLMAIVGAVVFGALLIFITQHHGESYLKLTPTGVDLYNGTWGRQAEATWDDIKEIRDHPTRGKNPDRAGIVMVLREKECKLIVTDHLTPGGRGIQEWITHYWKNPQDRTELTDHRATDRLLALAGLTDEESN